MKNNKRWVFILIGLLGIGLVGIAGYSMVVQPQLENRTISVTVPTPISYPETGFSFMFPSGVDALALIEPPISTSTDSSLKKAYLLMNTKEFNEYNSLVEKGTPPPTISIFIVGYASTEDESADAGRISKLQTWAQNNPQYSSWGRMSSELEVVEVDGAPAIHYQTTGEYQQSVYVTLYQKNMYILTAQFDEGETATQSIFSELISSVTFD